MVKFSSGYSQLPTKFLIIVFLTLSDISYQSSDFSIPIFPCWMYTSSWITSKLLKTNWQIHWQKYWQIQLSWQQYYKKINFIFFIKSISIEKSCFFLCPHSWILSSSLSPLNPQLCSGTCGPGILFRVFCLGFSPPAVCRYFYCRFGPCSGNGTSPTLEYSVFAYYLGACQCVSLACKLHKQNQNAALWNWVN